MHIFVSCHVFNSLAKTAELGLDFLFCLFHLSYQIVLRFASLTNDRQLPEVLFISAWKTKSIVWIVQLIKHLNVNRFFGRVKQDFNSIAMLVLENTI